MLFLFLFFLTAQLSRSPTSLDTRRTGRSSCGSCSRSFSETRLEKSCLRSSWVVRKLTEVRTPTTPTTRTRRPPSRVPFGGSSTGFVRTFPACRVARALRSSVCVRSLVSAASDLWSLVLKHPAQAAAATVHHLVLAFVALLLPGTTTIAVTRRQ